MSASATWVEAINKHRVPYFHIVEMRVHMCCNGCECKIKKALSKLEGIDNIDIDMPNQKVTVTGYADQKKVLKTVRRTGRRAELWPFAYNPEINNYSPQVTQAYYQQSQAPSSTHYHNAAQPASSSHYNYYKHGYDTYYQQPSQNTLFDQRAGAMFSDENPNACSVM